MEGRRRAGRGGESVPAGAWVAEPTDRPAKLPGEALSVRYNNAMGVIRQSDLRNENAAVMRRVAAGESFVVTVNGRPVADVTPHEPGTGKRRLVPVAEVTEAFSAGPAPDPAAWLRDIAEADVAFGPDQPDDPFERKPA